MSAAQVAPPCELTKAQQEQIVDAVIRHQRVEHFLFGGDVAPGLSAERGLKHLRPTFIAES
jgi:hypothetical protein